MYIPICTILCTLAWHGFRGVPFCHTDRWNSLEDKQKKPQLNTLVKCTLRFYSNNTGCHYEIFNSSELRVFRCFSDLCKTQTLVENDALCKHHNGNFEPCTCTLAGHDFWILRVAVTEMWTWLQITQACRNAGTLNTRGSLAVWNQISS